jgi:hypothetical protein
VLFEDGIYKMWLYTAGNDGGGIVPWVSYMTSTNGIDWNWNERSPLFGRSFEDWLWLPRVLNVDGSYQLWHGLFYEGEGRVGYATAPDEVDWIKHDGPVMSGTPGEWDAGRATNPSVLHAGKTYTMYYSGGNSLGVATSDDGITWTKHMSSPIMTPGTFAHWGEPTVEFFGGTHGSVLDGLTITGGDGESAGGVHAGGIEGIVIRDCVIRDNRCMNLEYGSGGVVAGGGLAMIDTELRHNQGAAAGGASAVRGDRMHLVNVLLASNWGAPAIHSNARVTLTNVTASRNEDGTLTWNPLAPVSITIRNSIFYGNAAGFDFPENCTADGLCIVTYSDIEGGWPGEGNIADDPAFVDPENGDFHLHTDSPCIDAGTLDGAPERDLDGKLRDAEPDMGAYEWGYQVFLPLVMKG